jgi:hypothetical protein
MQSVPATELKRRGLAAVEDLLGGGPVHVIKNSRPACVVISVAEYQRLLAAAAPAPEPAPVDIWTLMLQPVPGGRRSREEIDAELDAQRSEWDRPSAGR